jgi:rhodanese-related sulfurtransferase
MITTIKKLLGFGPKVDLGELIKNGAVILDVRTKGEFQSGHVKGSVNIPLQNLSGHIGKLDKKKTIITCCASGMRSASAKGLLKSNGFQEVHNGGSWTSLRKFI